MIEKFYLLRSASAKTIPMPAIIASNPGVFGCAAGSGACVLRGGAVPLARAWVAGRAALGGAGGLGG